MMSLVDLVLAWIKIDDPVDVDRPLTIWRMVSEKFDLDDADLVMFNTGEIRMVRGIGDNRHFYSPIIGKNRVARVVAYRRRGVEKSRVISRKTILENRK